MSTQESQEFVRRFIGLSREKQQIFWRSLRERGVDFSLYPIPGGLARDERAPLSFAQRRMWVLWQLQPDSGAYNIASAVRLDGPLDVAALEQAFAALIMRHSALRTTFDQDDEQPYQAVQVLCAFQLQVRPCAEAQVQASLQAEAVAPFDLRQGPLLRAVLLQLDGQRQVLSLCMHHIVADGWSMNLLISELVALYGQFSGGAQAALSELPIEYVDYALWQKSLLEAGEAEHQLAYWRQTLGDEHPPLELPADRLRPAEQSLRGASLEFALAPALSQGLRALARSHNATLFMVLLAAFKVLLHRYSGQADIRVGVPVANRNRVETEGLIGFFVNTQVLRSRLDGQASFVQLLAQIKASVLQAQAHQDLPFEQLLDGLNLARSLSYNPLFQVMYNHQRRDLGSLEGLAELKAEVLGVDTQVAKFDLSLDTAEDPSGQVFATLSYATDLFNAPRMQRLREHFETLLAQILVKPDCALAKLSLIDSDELARQRAWNGPQTPAVAFLPIHQRIAEQARQRPQATAVICQDQRLSFAQLDNRANQLAWHLQELGIGPEVRVAVALPRSPDLLVALLAVLKAGGAYVPLDASYPAERLAYLMSDAGVALLISDASLLPELPVPTQLPVLDMTRVELAGRSNRCPQVSCEPGHLAYLIYTSGSTGQPKGVAVAHGPLAMHCAAIGQRYQMTERDCELHFMSFAFDGAHERWLTTLSHGASLLLRDDNLWTPEQTFEALHTHQVSVVAFPPVYLQQLAEHAERQGNPPPVRIYCFGGDAVPEASFELVKRVLRPEFIINGYGPTETVVTPLIWKAAPDERCGAAYAPIGSLIGQRSAWVLDTELNPVPLGAVGELYLGGEGLARGYHQRSALTAERFVADPFSDGGRLYRSGDLVRQREDGVVEYIGRIDQQVKIRGFRIELGEVEARLQQHPQVREAVVVARDGVTGKQLVGYVITQASARDDTSLVQSIKAWLRETLPDYMVPAHLVLLDRLPLTPNGKLDRKALPAPDLSQLQDTFVVPQGPIEQALAEIWQRLLGIEHVGREDNFFQLGGDSIVAIQVVSRARQAGLKLSPKDLFQQQTLAALAAVAQHDSQVLIDQAPAQGSLLPTPIQRWFFDLELSNANHWNQSLLLHPRQPLAVEALRTALQAVLAHHDGLRLAFAERQAQFLPSGAIPEPLWVRPLPHLDALPALCAEAQASLDLATGALMRAVLVTLADGEQRLLLVVHHLVIDGVSWRILLEDLHTAWQQACQGQVPRLAPRTTSLQQWSQHLHRYASSPRLLDELNFWKAQLAGASAALPEDGQPQQTLHAHATRLRTVLDRQRTRQLMQQAPASYRTQINDLLLTALARVLVRWTGQPSALLQLEGHGREEAVADADLSRTVGWFTSVYPLQLVPRREMAESIMAIKEQLRAVPDKGLGYGVLRYLSEHGAALVALAQPRITFNYLGQFDASFDAEAAWLPASEPRGSDVDALAPLTSDLGIDGQVYDGCLSLTWTFSTERFNVGTIQALADGFNAELEELIEHCLCVGEAGVTPSDFTQRDLTQDELNQLAVPVADIEDIYLLTALQQGMLFHCLYEPQTAAYVNQMRVDVDGLDVEAFCSAWQATVDRHPVLRAGFCWEGLARPLQVIHRQARLSITLKDWRGQAELATTLEQLAQTDQAAGFVLDQAPLLRLTLVRSGEDRHHLIFTSHHLLLDGWSNSQLLGEVLQRYSSQALAPSAGSYRDYLGWLQQRDPAVSQVFWHERLGQLDEPTRLAQVLSKGSDMRGHGEHRLLLDAPMSRALGDFARQHKSTLNTVVQAAWALLLQRYSGQSGVAFGVTVSGRPAQLPGIEQQLGLFINTLPMILAPRPQQSVEQWLHSVQAAGLALRDHEYTALADIQRWAGHNGEALFDTLLVFENYPLSEALQAGAPQGLRFGPVRSEEQTNYPLTLVVTAAGPLSLQFKYQHQAFSAQAVETLAGHLRQLLVAFMAQPQASLAEVCLLGDQQRDELLNTGRRSGALNAPVHTLAQWFEAQVARSPEALALIAGQQRLSYADLNQQANRLAHKLRAMGVAPGVLVGVALQRSASLPVALLAILKAGGAYVPIDPDYPRDRQAYMLTDSQARLLITQQSLLASLPADSSVQRLCVEDDLDGFPSTNPVTLSRPEDLAYVIYTSGSTGQPKGVAIEQRNASALISWAQGVYTQADLQGVLASTSVCFDLSVWEFFVTLASGGYLLLADNALVLPQLPSRDLVRLINTVPSAIAALLRAGQIPESVRIVNLAGEALQQSLVDALYALPHIKQVFDLYGPSEDTTYSTISRRQAGGRSSIGRTLPGTTSYLLDPYGALVPYGVVGELYLAGAGLARGYLGKPALSAEKFLADPFAGDGQRMYRTGDLARYNAQGDLEYVGRIDHQVKIRGLRIELGEIEAGLLAHPQVSAALVQAQMFSGSQQLVAYVATEVVEVSVDSLKAHLRERLPGYMVPTHFALLASLPLTPNGKVDRKALPAIVCDTGAEVAPVMAGNTIEQTLLEVWQAVLGQADIGVHDNFFELGGDSIISIQVVGRARQAGLRLSPKDLFEHPSIYALARVARLDQGDNCPQGPVSGEQILTPIQRWFFERQLAHPQHWNQAVLLHLREPLGLDMLGRALQALEAHHDVLRLAFGSTAAHYRDIAPELDIWHRHAADSAELQRHCDDAQASLDLAQGPLWRAMLVDLADGSQRLLLVIHHLVVDGVSWRVLLKDLHDLCQQISSGQAPQLPAKTSTFQHWAERLQAYASSDLAHAQLGYWQAQLQGADVPLPGANPLGSHTSQHACSVISRLDADNTRQLLQQAPAAYRSQVNDLLLSALARVVCRWTGEGAAHVLLEGHGREELFAEVDLSRTLGWFTSAYPQRLTPATDMATTIKTVKEQLRAAPDKGVGFGVLRYLSDDVTRQGLKALGEPRITFNYLGQLDASLDAQGRFGPARESSGSSQAADTPLSNWLNLNGQVMDGQLTVHWSFSEQVFEPAAIQALADDYAQELRALIAHCLGADAGALTPSDVVGVNLSQDALDELLSDF